MSIKTINVGAVQNDGTGDQLRDAFGKVNENFAELDLLKAPKDSPALTGAPTAPTQAADNDTTRVATTAFVVGQAATVAPVMAGAAAVGASLRFARQDHRHPTDTTRAPLASPAFTGTPTGITKTHVGLGNVDNTSDANKPVSTAQQAALNLKAPLASPVFTGTARSDHLTLGGTVTARLYYKNAINANVLESGIGTLTGFGDSFGLFVQNSTGRFDIGTNGATRLTVDKDGNTTFSGSIRTIAYSTTAAAANCVLQADGWVLRSTSSARYKKDVEPLDGAIADSIYSMRPVWYRSTSEADPAAWSWLGLIAEEVAAVEPRLAQWSYTPEDYVPGPERVVYKQIGADSEGKPVYERKVYPGDPVLKAGAQKVPDGVQYERIVVPLIACVQAQRRQIEALEMRVAALEVPR